MSVELVFDPGTHTGVALFVEGELVETNLIYFNHRSEPDISEGFATIARLVAHARTLAQPDKLLVICESFHTRLAGIGVSSDGMLTARLTGWIEGLARTGGDSIWWVEPSAKASFEREAKLLRPRATIHERDAIAHGLRWLAMTPSRPLANR